MAKPPDEQLAALEDKLWPADQHKPMPTREDLDYIAFTVRQLLDDGATDAILYLFKKISED